MGRAQALLTGECGLARAWMHVLTDLHELQVHVGTQIQSLHTIAHQRKSACAMRHTHHAECCCQKCTCPVTRGAWCVCLLMQWAPETQAAWR